MSKQNRVSQGRLLSFKHVSMSCFLGPAGLVPHCVCRARAPTLGDGQASEFSQGGGGCRAAEQGQRVGSQGTAVGVRNQGCAGLQEVSGFGNGTPLLLQGGVGVGWEAEPWEAAQPSSCRPPSRKSQGHARGNHWLACSPSLCIHDCLQPQLSKPHSLSFINMLVPAFSK